MMTMQEFLALSATSKRQIEEIGLPKILVQYISITAGIVIQVLPYGS